MNVDNTLAESAEQFLERVKSVRSGGGVRRYHTHRVICEDTVAAHSWGVACVLDQLYYTAGVTISVRLLQAAMYHDVAEHVFGDIPSPAKRLMDSEKLRRQEDSYMRERGLFTELTDFERCVLKIADIIDGMLYCREELARGNTTLLPIAGKYSEYLTEKVVGMSKLAESEGALGTAIYKSIGFYVGYLTSNQGIL